MDRNELQIWNPKHQIKSEIFKEIPAFFWLVTRLYYGFTSESVKSPSCQISILMDAIPFSLLRFVWEI